LRRDPDTDAAALDVRYREGGRTVSVCQKVACAAIADA
jgi:hypothetical protein